MPLGAPIFLLFFAREANFVEPLLSFGRDDAIPRATEQRLFQNLVELVAHDLVVYLYCPIYVQLWVQALDLCGKQLLLASLQTVSDHSPRSIMPACTVFISNRLLYIVVQHLQLQFACVYVVQVSRKVSLENFRRATH